MIAAIVPLLCSGWLIGVALGSLLSPFPTLGLVVLAGGSVAATAIGRARVIRGLGLMLLALLLGALWADHAAQGDYARRDIWATFIQERPTVQGRIVSSEERGTTFVLVLENIHSTKRPDIVLPGFLRASVRGAEKIPEGSLVELRGTVRLPEDPKTQGDFDARRYFERHHIAALMQYPRLRVLEEGKPGMLTRVRERARETLRQTLPEPSAGLLSALLLSYDHDLPEEIREDIAASGVAHLIAISGSHIALLAAAVFGILLSLGCTRMIASVITLLLASVFLLLVDLPASGVRSLIMAVLFAAAYGLGRRADGLRILLLSATVMTIANPRILLADVGFQLSVLAMWGLATLYPLLKRLVPGRSDVFGLRSLVLLTLAAELATAPIVLSVFHRVSLIGLLTNIVAIPLFPVLLLAAVGAILLGQLPLLGPLVVALAHGVSTVFLRVVDTAASVPWAELRVTAFSPVFILLTVGVLVFLSILSSKRGMMFVRTRFRIRPKTQGASHFEVA